MCDARMYSMLSKICWIKVVEQGVDRRNGQRANENAALCRPA